MSQSLSSELSAQEAELAVQVLSIRLPDVVFTGDDSAIGALTTKIKASILSEFAKWLARNSDLLPPKETVLAFLDSAIDRAITAIDLPVWAKLITPVVKKAILIAAEKLYDSLVNPAPQV